MHTIRFKLKVTKSDACEIDRRFRSLCHIHNVLVKHAIKLLKKLERDPEYSALKQEYCEILSKSQQTTSDEKQRKELSRDMDRIRKDIGLTEYGLQSYIKVCGKQFRKQVSSQQVQKEAQRVWKGVEKVLFGNGKKLRYKKPDEMMTIGGKSNLNGAKFDKKKRSVSWLGLHLACKAPRREKDIAYMKESLSTDISYCEIARKMFAGGWHYYVIVYLKGPAPRKERKVGKGVTGIDMGTSIMAAVSDETAVLQELAPESNKYNHKIEKLLRQMDISRRNSNPEKYNEDGTINRKNHEQWNRTKGYDRKFRQLKTLYRKKAAYIKQSHLETIYQLLKVSNEFITENMDYKALQKRGKHTERSEKGSKVTVKNKKGSNKPVYKEIRKYKRKKRFGKSLNDRAPGMFLELLERRSEIYGGQVHYVDTWKYKASQYDHVKDMYIKAPLNQREKEVGGRKVQRDLYSAYLLKNADEEYKQPDRKKCVESYKRFLKLQDQEIERMKEQGISKKYCYGF